MVDAVRQGYKNAMGQKVGFAKGGAVGACAGGKVMKKAKGGKTKK